jgi:hypothetical protein
MLECKWLFTSRVEFNPSLCDLGAPTCFQGCGCLFALLLFSCITSIVCKYCLVTTRMHDSTPMCLAYVPLCTKDHNLRACLVARMKLNQARGMQGVDVWLPARPLELGPARAKVPLEPGSRHASKSAVSAETGSPHVGRSAQTIEKHMAQA